MGDPSREWKDQEYPTEGNTGKASWILNKGLGWGKKILVGGVVVSSAPFVLPSLVVISVLGVALSIPYGVILGSYACTEKLMSKLLSPPPPPSSESETVSNDEEEGDVGCGGKFNVEKEEKELMEDIKGGVEMRIELVDNGLEQLGGGKVSEEYNYEQGSPNTAKQGLVEVVGEIMEENGCMEHVGEYFDEENRPLEVIGTCEGLRKGEVEELLTESREEQSINEVEVVIEGDVLEGGNVEEVETPHQVTSILVEEYRNQERANDIEDDELVRGTRGLLEKIRDERKEDIGEEEMHGGAEVVDQETHRTIEEMEMPIEAESAYNSKVRMEKPTRATKERNTEEVLGEIEEMREPRYAETMYTVSEEVNPTEEIIGNMIEESKSMVNMEPVFERASVIEDDELVSGTRGLVEKIRDEEIEDTGEEEMHGGAEVIDQETHRTIEEMEMPIEAKGAYNSNVRMEKPTRAIKERNTEEVLGETEEMTEPRYMETMYTVSESEEVNPTEEIIGNMIEESKSMVNMEPVFEAGRAENNAANGVIEDSQLNGKKDIVVSLNEDGREIADGSGFDLFDDRNAAESEQFSSDIAFESGYSAELHLSAGLGVPESKSQISIGKDIIVPSNEVSYNEEKIWEQIHAVRTIVGYKAAIRATCIEELKALYIFTGIEPPASFQNPSNLVEVNDKLQFLMSIIGVK